MNLDDILNQLDEIEMIKQKKREHNDGISYEDGASHNSFSLEEMNGILANLNGMIHTQDLRIKNALIEKRNWTRAQKYWKGLIDEKVKERFSN